jgi:hypothetical protein
LLINPKVYFPFFTAQWKRGVAQDPAIAQGACDGAVIINHIRRLLPDATFFRNTDEYLIQASHVSITFEGYTALFYIHWYNMDTKTYHMERFLSCAVDEVEHCVTLRRVLRNLQDWAMDSRLQYIKIGLDRLSASIINLVDGGGSTEGRRSKKSKTGNEES